MIDILLVIAGLAGLFFGGEMFVQAAARLARSLGISTLVVGLTVVAIGTSMPELIVSVGAALDDNSDIALGNVIGSNIANIGLIIGVAALISPFAIHVRMVRREIPLMIATTIATYLLMLDGQLSRVDGILLLLGGVTYLGWMVYSSRQESAQDTQEAPLDIPRQREALRLLAGLLILLLGARLIVDGATALARGAGISELVIGMTLVAIGTSLPELVTSTVAARKKESDIALGNVVGSNLANLLIILGTTATLRPITVADSVIQQDGPVMVAFALLIIPFAFNRKIDRREGIFFVGAYAAYIIFLFFVRSS